MKKLILLLFLWGTALYAQTSVSIDPSFTGITSGFNGGINSIAVQSDGKILVGGYFTTYNGVDCPGRLVRITSTGEIDNSFNGITSGFNGSVNSIALQSDGKILVGGSFTQYNDQDCPGRLVRLTSTGEIDNSFTVAASGFNGSVNSIAIQSDEKILVGGGFTSFIAADCPDLLVRLTSTGDVDNTFSGITTGFADPFFSNVFSVAIQSDGNILVGGRFSTYNGNACPNFLVRLTSSGVLDNSIGGFSDMIGGFVRAIAIQSDGNILVGGGFSTYKGGNCPHHFVRLTSTGELDESFAGIGIGFDNGSVYSIAIQSDGKILVGGSFSTFNGADCPDNIVRLASTGELDESFTGTGTGFDMGSVNSIAVQDDEKILVGGSFSTFNGADCPDNLARFSVPISLTTTPISAITGTDAVSGGTINDARDNSITARGICWNTAGLPTKDLLTKSEETGTFGSGVFSANLSGLRCGKVYHVRAYATNADGTTYGDELTFTTIPTPELYTQPITSIQSNSATSGGFIFYTGESDITDRGVCWNSTGNPKISDDTTKQTSSYSDGSFSANLTGLALGQKYYVRAYATNSAGTGYGHEISFTTYDPENVSKMSFQGLLTDNSGKLLNDGNYSITFKLYDALTGGTQVWTETQTVAVARGMVNVNLGAVNPIDAVKFNTSYWLGITVGSGSELSPRTAITGSAYPVGSIGK